MNNMTNAAKLAAFSSDSMFSGARAVLLSKTMHQYRKDLVAPIQRKCLELVPIHADQTTGERIKDMSLAFLSTDESQVAKLYEAYKAELLAAGGCGLTREEIEGGKCPELVAAHLLIQAENVLLDMVGEVMGFKRVTLTIAQRAKVIDLALRMVVQAPGFTCELPALPAGAAK